MSFGYPQLHQAKQKESLQYLASEFDSDQDIKHPHKSLTQQRINTETSQGKMISTPTILHSKTRQPSDNAPLSSRKLLKDETDEMEESRNESSRNNLETEEGFNLMQNQLNEQIKRKIEVTSQEFSRRANISQELPDPLQGESFIRQVMAANLIQNGFKSPFDFSQTVQTLAIPQHEDQYLTVHQVVLNTFHHKTNEKQDATQQLDVFKCPSEHAIFFGLKPETKSSSKDEDLAERKVIQCQNCNSEQEKYWQCEVTDDTGPHCLYCSSCFTTCYTKRRLTKKSHQHKFWIPFNLKAEKQDHWNAVRQHKTLDQKFKMTENKEELKWDTNEPNICQIAVIGVWKHTELGIQCWRQFYCKDAIFFEQNHCKGHEPWEKVFLHLTERKDDNHQELFFFQQDDQNQIFISTISMNEMIDPKMPRFTSSAQFSKDLFRLPIKNRIKIGTKLYQELIKNFEISPYKDASDDQINIASNFQCLPKLIDDDTLVIQKKYSNENKQQSLIFYNLTKDQLEINLLNAVCLLKVQYNQGNSEAAWVLENSDTIKKYSLSTQESICTFKISDHTSIDCLKGFNSLSGLCGFIHNQDTRCTILSYTAKKWITFNLEENTTQTLYQYQQNKVMSVSIWHPQPDKLYIFVGLTKCFNGEINCEGYMKYGMNVHKMSQKVLKDDSQINITVQLPNDIVSKTMINSNHIFPVQFKSINKKKSDQRSISSVKVNDVAKHKASRQYKIVAFIFYADAVSKLPTSIFVQGSTVTEEK